MFLRSPSIPSSLSSLFLPLPHSLSPSLPLPPPSPCLLSPSLSSLPPLSLPLPTSPPSLLSLPPSLLPPQLLKLPQSSSSAYLALCSLIRRLFLVLSPQAQASVLFPLPHHSFSFTPPSLSNAQMSVVESFSPITPFRIKLWTCLDLGSLPSAQSEVQKVDTQGGHP